MSYCTYSRSNSYLANALPPRASSWVSGGAMVDYKGPRQTMEMVQFAQQQNAISVIKGKVGEVAQGVKAMGKLAMSKVLGRAQASPAPEQMAQPPPAAAAA